MNKKLASTMLMASLAVGSAALATNVYAEETVNLTMQIASFGLEWPGLENVEAAINAITEPEIGVTVTLDPEIVWDLPSISSLAITSGEEIDLMAIIPLTAGLDSVSNYTMKNMLLPLDDLYAEYGQDIPEVIGNLEQLGYVGGSLYAIPANYYAGHGYAFLARTSELEALGRTYDENQIYTLDDIEDLLAAWQESKGAGYYAICGYSDVDIPSMLCPTDDLGNPAVGSLMNGGLDNTTVVNKFATEEYKQAYERVRDWYNKGYINPDIISITDTWPSLFKTGQYLGAFSATNGAGLEGILVNEQNAGEDVTTIRFVDDYATTTAASYGLWAIPVTCEYPEKAMQLLNLLYQKRELSENVAALLSSGIEGETYQVLETLDDGRVIVDYLEGMDRNSAPYAGALPIYGDEMRTPKYTPIDAALYDEMIAYNDTLDYSQAFGYTFDSTNYSNQISAINNVLETYNSQLVFGIVDVDTVLPQFLSELEAAGINEVIAANQEQLDAWKALQ